MQSDQPIISQLEEAVGSAKQTLEEAKQRHEVRITALRAEQRQEIERIQTQVQGYEKALRAVTGSNGQRESLGWGKAALAAFSLCFSKMPASVADAMPL